MCRSGLYHRYRASVTQALYLCLYEGFSLPYITKLIVSRAATFLGIRHFQVLRTVRKFNPLLVNGVQFETKLFITLPISISVFKGLSILSFGGSKGVKNNNVVSYILCFY